eukprot:CAMPEP_0203750302 /NCGR_PEP_ID=MMETSP0098-20131031/4555_1 /ASSEMBLY_ACC=CAM_ASM_000208 /TAXON_ID=96639 /ORGANISM=" , Strain NY0313808BC1" /LENGTH=575 /DNA_ID=CAMNT_0050639531 /DNA_START=121 /DNA_END=1845 /DNA_ORIENTATION=-
MGNGQSESSAKENVVTVASRKSRLRRESKRMSRRSLDNTNSTERTLVANRGRKLFSDFQEAQASYAKKWGESKGLEGIKTLFEKEAPRLATKYHILNAEACGVTAVVCRAVNIETQDIVAVKFVRIRVEGLSDAVRRTDCKEEARLQRRCEHKHVVKLLDFEMGNNFALYILEYVKTTLLKNIIERNEQVAYSERIAAGYIQGIASALRKCHAQGVVHMDVKLDNILCTEDNIAKLCDFGVAEQMQFHDSPIQRNVAAPLFAPPEIYTTGYCDTKADMWSLGVVLYILLCGYPPFKETDLKPRIVRARYAFPERDWANVSIMARDLISRLLVIDTKQRFSAAQVLEHPWIQAASPPRPNSPIRKNNTKSAASPPKEPDANRFVPLPLRVTQFLRNMHHYRELEKTGFENVPGGQLYRKILDGVDEIAVDMTNRNKETEATETPVLDSPSWLARRINKILFATQNAEIDDDKQVVSPFLPHLQNALEQYYYPDEDDDYQSSVTVSYRPSIQTSRSVTDLPIKVENTFRKKSSDESSSEHTGKDIYAQAKERKRIASANSLNRKKSFEIFPIGPLPW